MMNKKVKVPQELLEYLKVNPEGRGKGNAAKFVRENYDLLSKPSPYFIEPMGMGQGIFQEFSSILHSIKKTLEMEILYKIYGSELKMAKAAVSSDDSIMTLVLYMEKRYKLEKSMIWEILTKVGDKVGSFFSILKNKSKSAYNIFIAEFNSKFYFRRKAAMPTAKFKAAKLEIGMGTNPTADLAQALNSASDYLSSGGSYLGAYVIISLNTLMIKEHWTRHLTKDSNLSYLGSMKIIEPLSNFYCLPIVTMIANDYSVLSDKSISEMNKEDVSKMTRYLVKILRLDPEKSLAEDEDNADSLYDLMAGHFSVAREYRDRVLNKVTIKKFEEAATTFTFKLKAQTYAEMALKMLTNLSVKTSTSQDVPFHSRLSEPWTNFEGDSYHVNTKTPLYEILEKNKTSRLTLFAILKSKEYEAKVFRAMINTATKEELTEFEAEISTAIEPWFKNLINTYRGLSRLTTERPDVKRVAHMMTKTMRVKSTAIAFEDKNINYMMLGAKYLGKDSIFAVNKVTSNIEEFRSIAEASTEVINPIKFIKAMASYDSRLSSVESSRKVICMPATTEIADPAEIFRLVLTTRLIEGAGFAMRDNTEFEASWTKGMSMLKEERAFTADLRIKSAKHLMRIMETGNSDFMELITDTLELGKAAETLYESFGNDSRSVVSRMMFKISLSLVKGENSKMNPDELHRLLTGHASIPSSIKVGNSTYTHVPSTRSEEKNLMSHIVEKIGDDDFANFVHHFIVYSEKTYSKSCTIDKCNARFNFLKNKDMFTSSFDDSTVIHLNTSLTNPKIKMDKKSTMIYAEFDKFILPLFTIAPNFEENKLFNIDEEGLFNYLEKASSEYSKMALELAKLQLKQKQDMQIKLSEAHKKWANEDNLDSSTEWISSAIVTNSFPIEFDFGEKIDMITKPFVYVPKRKTITDILDIEHLKDEEIEERDIYNVIEESNAPARVDKGFLFDLDFTEQLARAMAEGQDENDYDDFITEGLKAAFEEKLNYRIKRDEEIIYKATEGFMRMSSNTITALSIRNAIVVPLYKLLGFPLEFRKMRKDIQPVNLIGYVNMITDLSKGVFDEYTFKIWVACMINMRV